MIIIPYAYACIVLYAHNDMIDGKSSSKREFRICEKLISPLASYETHQKLISIK